MILEIVGSRILAPYFGTSIVVWTSLIGIILACLSLGYLLGGKLADRQLNYRLFSTLLFASSLFIGIVSIFQSSLLAAIQHLTTDIRVGVVISTAVLFGIPGVLLGMVPPYAIRLTLKSLEHSGETIGRIYAISTIGSITGTFLAGFFLISYIGSTKILLVLSITLLILSWLAFQKSAAQGKSRVLMLHVASAAIILSANLLLKPASKYLVDIDTAYHRIWIFDSTERATNRPIRSMATDPRAIQSSMYLDKDDEPVDEYINFYRLAKHFKPDFQTSLMIGGAGYSYPKDYLRRFKDATLDVVEIDPGMTELARRYFNLKDDPRLTIYHRDGRIFLNNTRKQYDVIMVDAVKSFYSMPYQLSTIEAVTTMHDRLTNDGVLFINMIGAFEGDNSRFVRAEYVTCKSVFPQVYLFAVNSKNDGLLIQSVILVALKSDRKINLDNEDRELTQYLSQLWTRKINTELPILTDDFAPVDFYTLSMLIP